MNRAQQALQWLRGEIKNDAEDWQERGFAKSIAFAVVDAWLWFGSGVRLLVYVCLAQFYLPDDTVLHDVADVQWGISPRVVDGVPRQVDGNLRTATCVLGLAAIAAVGVWPTIWFGTPASRVWIASQLWFLALDPVWGVWHHATGGGQNPSDSAWRPLTAANRHED